MPSDNSYYHLNFATTNLHQRVSVIYVQFSISTFFYWVSLYSKAHLVTRHNVRSAKIIWNFLWQLVYCGKSGLVWSKKTVSTSVFVWVFYSGAWPVFIIFLKVTTSAFGAITALKSSSFQPSRRRGDTAHYSCPIQQFGHHDRRWVEQTGRPRGLHPGSTLRGRLSPGKRQETTQFNLFEVKWTPMCKHFLCVCPGFSQVLRSHESRGREHRTSHYFLGKKTNSRLTRGLRELQPTDVFFFYFFFRDVTTEWIITSAEAAGVFSELPKYEVKRITKMEERTAG